MGLCNTLPIHLDMLGPKERRGRLPGGLRLRVADATTGSLGLKNTSSWHFLRHVGPQIQFLLVTSLWYFKANGLNNVG